MRSSRASMSGTPRERGDLGAALSAHSAKGWSRFESSQQAQAGTTLPSTVSPPLETATRWSQR
jgi:hypothetical protein